MRKNVIIGVLIVALAVVGVLEYRQMQQVKTYRTQIENNYQYDFQSLLDCVRSIETTLSKANVSSAPSSTTVLLTDVWRQADLAQNHLNRLPLEHNTLKDTASFLNKLSDFSYAIAKLNIDGKGIDDEQKDDLKRLKNTSTYLLQQIQLMNEKVQSGEIKFTSEKKVEDNNLDESSDDLITKGFSSVEKEMVDYPKLIYDGPFSDHIEDIEPKWIKGEQISEEEGAEKVEEFIGEDLIENIESSGSAEGEIKTYVYDVEIKDQEENAYVEISQKGGHVLKMMINRVPKEQKMTVEEAGEKADEYLRERGYENLTKTYHEKYTNTAVFNYAYEQDDVLIYPDLIKVQVALDTGQVLGLEAQGFHMAHHEREIQKPKISLDEARELVSDNLEITNERLAIIPTDFKTEILCYEFKGTYNYEWFIVYINAETGKEEQILKIIEADESVLTL